MTTSRVTKSVKVIIHIDGQGNTAIGLIVSEWRGAHRVDRRLSAARPTGHRAGDAPPGVMPEVWLAMLGLEAAVVEQERAHDSRLL